MENIKIEDREVYLVLRPNDLIENYLSINGMILLQGMKMINFH